MPYEYQNLKQQNQQDALDGISSCSLIQLILHKHTLPCFTCRQAVGLAWGESLTEQQNQLHLTGMLAYVISIVPKLNNVIVSTPPPPPNINIHHHFLKCSGPLIYYSHTHNIKSNEKRQIILYVVYP